MDVAIGMMLFIFIIANVGGLYFYLRDRKHMRRQSEQNGNDRLTLDDINNEIQQTRAARRAAGLCSQRLRGIASHAPKNFDYKKELENRF